MIKGIASIIPILFLTLTLSAQELDWNLSVPPYGRNAFDVVITDSGRVFMFGGSPSNDSISTIAFTFNSVEWDVKMDKVNSPVLNDAHFISKDIGIVVGEVGMVLKSIDAGTKWEKIDVPLSVKERKFKSIFFTNKTVGYIVGGNPTNDSISTILKTKDAGDTWLVVKDGLGPMLNDVYFINDNLGFAVGEYGFVLKTEDAGITWTKINLSSNVSSRIFNSVYFNTDKSGFIIGGNPTNDSIQTILKTSDAGITWSIEKDKPDPMLQDISFQNKDKGLMVGNNGFAKETKDGGKTWTNVVLPNVNDQWFFTSVHYYNDSTAVIGGRNGAVFLSFDSSSFRALGLHESLTNNLGIYPNPVKKYFTFEGGILPNFKIFNTSGKVINESMYSMDNNKVLVSDLPKGVYFVRWIDRESVVFNHKIIIQ